MITDKYTDWMETIREMVEYDATKTTIYAWDCNCDEGYINAKNTNNSYTANTCSICGAVEGEQPDGHESEVLEFIDNELARLSDALDDGAHPPDIYRQARELNEWRTLIENEEMGVEAQ